MIQEKSNLRFVTLPHEPELGFWNHGLTSREFSEVGGDGGVGDGVLGEDGDCVPGPGV